MHNKAFKTAGQKTALLGRHKAAPFNSTLVLII